jgi:hypothetical protein
MVATILNSPRAAATSVYIVRAWLRAERHWHPSYTAQSVPRINPRH